MNQTSTQFPTTHTAKSVGFQFGVTAGTPNGTFFVDVTNDPRIVSGNAAQIANVRWTVAHSVGFVSGLSPDGTASCACYIENAWLAARVRWVVSVGPGARGICFAKGLARQGVAE